MVDVIERVSRYVEHHPGCDAGEVRLAVPAIRGATDAALRRLERAGFIARRDGRYRSFKPYRAGGGVTSPSLHHNNRGDDLRPDDPTDTDVGEPTPSTREAPPP